MNKIQIQSNSENIEISKIKNIIVDCLDVFKIKNAHLNIIFISAEEITELNCKYRNINRPTDVLSFPQAKIPNQKIVLLGDIVISLDDVNKKNEEIEDVVKHGLLHLLGYDHEENESDWNKAAELINCNL
jgi:probable rRNA maturation factor